MTTIRLLIGIAGLALIATVGLVIQSAMPVPAAASPAAIVPVPGQQSLTDPQIRDVNAARWTGLGAVYLQAEQVARAADVARWAGLGEVYQRADLAARAADVARWAGLGATYMTPEQAARAADVARWEGLGQYYTSLNGVAQQ
jgi:hypothetical protein